MLKNPVYQVFLVRYCVFWHVQYQKQHVALWTHRTHHITKSRVSSSSCWASCDKDLASSPETQGIPRLGVSMTKGRNFENHLGNTSTNQPTNQPTVSFFNSSPQKDGLFPGESGEKVCNFMVHRCWKKTSFIPCGSFAYPCCLAKHLCSFPHERKLKGNPPFCGMGLGYLSCLLFPQTHKNRMLFVTPCMLQRLSHRNSHFFS